MNNEKISIASQITLRLNIENGFIDFDGQLISARDMSNGLHESPPLLIPPETLQQAVTDSLFDRLPCRVSHASTSQEPSQPHRFGAWHWPRYNPQTTGVKATLCMESSPQNLQIFAILSRTAIDKEFRSDISVSLTFSGDWQEEGSQRRLTRIHNIESADLTFMPTTDGRIPYLLSTIIRMPELKQSMTKVEYDTFFETMPGGDPCYFIGLAPYH